MYLDRTGDVLSIFRPQLFVLMFARFTQPDFPSVLKDLAALEQQIHQSVPDIEGMWHMLSEPEQEQRRLTEPGETVRMSENKVF